MVTISHIDHVVFTVKNIKTTCDFYQTVLNLKVDRFKDGRFALHFGSQKINLHEQGHEFEPKAKLPTPGAMDLCLIATTPLKEVVEHLMSCDVPIEQGPIERTGAKGKLHSVYIRDPDDNLIEISNYI